MSTGDLHPATVLVSALVGGVAGAFFEPVKHSFVDYRRNKLASRALYTELAFCKRRFQRAEENFAKFLKNHEFCLGLEPDTSATRHLLQKLEDERHFVYLALRDTKARAMEYYTHQGIMTLYEMKERPAIIAIEPFVTSALDLPAESEGHEALLRRMSHVSEALHLMKHYTKTGTLDPRSVQTYDARIAQEAEQRDSNLRKAKTKPVE